MAGGRLGCHEMCRRDCTAKVWHGRHEFELIFTKIEQKTRPDPHLHAGPGRPGLCDGVGPGDDERRRQGPAGRPQGAGGLPGRVTSARKEPEARMAAKSLFWRLKAART